jgi:hypothetical protein
LELHKILYNIDLVVDNQDLIKLSYECEPKKKVEKGKSLLSMKMKFFPKNDNISKENLKETKSKDSSRDSRDSRESMEKSNSNNDIKDNKTNSNNDIKINDKIKDKRTSTPTSNFLDDTDSLSENNTSLSEKSF